jgi:hypothetical protein
MLKRTFANKTAGRHNGPKFGIPLRTSFPRLGPFHLALATPPTCSHRNQGQETQVFCLLPAEEGNW